MKRHCVKWKRHEEHCPEDGPKARVAGFGHGKSEEQGRAELLNSKADVPKASTSTVRRESYPHIPDHEAAHASRQ
jgi:hypothetical protein